MGGRNYLRNLFAAITSISGASIKPVLFSGRKQSVSSSDFPGVEIITTPMLDRKTPAWITRKLIATISGRDLCLQRFLLKHDIAVLSHSSHLGRQSRIPTVGWIPDFQHVALPAFFTSEERTSLDTHFRSICALCDKVIVSSEDARSDLRAFSPEYADKAELLQFVANPISFTNSESLSTLRALYNFDGPYFLLPNQFWAHKNHRVVIDALRELKARGTPMLVLATGSTQDHRNPDYFASLMEYAQRSATLECFHVLGQIPFAHLSGLMRYTTAFLNPSQFEGWSTSVEEAKSMGKQVVLSDIPVHQEQNPGRGFFFSSNNASSLADAMAAANTAFSAEEDVAKQQEALALFSQRQRCFGEAYARIVQTLWHATRPIAPYPDV